MNVYNLGYNAPLFQGKIQIDTMELVRFYAWVSFLAVCSGCNNSSLPNNEKAMVGHESAVASFLNDELQKYIVSNDSALQTTGKGTAYYVLLFMQSPDDSLLDISSDVTLPVFFDDQIKFSGGFELNGRTILVYSNSSLFEAYITKDLLNSDISVFEDQVRGRMREVDIFPVWSYKLYKNDLRLIGKTKRTKVSDN